MKKILLVIFLFGICNSIFAVNESDSTVYVNTPFWNGIAKTASWNRPFWADMHSTLVRGETAMALNSSEYDWAKNGKLYRPYVFANLGADLPVWSGNFSSGKYGLRITIPFIIDVWLDMFERITAPVINTSYRFGAPEFSFIHRISGCRFLENYVIQLSPMKHECTHIGDELTIMRKNEGLPLTRINVSYNYAELAVTLNDPDGTRNSNFAFKMGLLMLHNFANGWYNIMPEEGDVTIVAPSEYPIEFYFQYQYQTKTSKYNFQGIFSAEIRNRPKYGYPQYYVDNNEKWVQNEIPEYRAWSINAFAGVRYSNPTIKGYFSKIGLGLRIYQGINPYGQFRSQPVYNQVGLAIIFE